MTHLTNIIQIVYQKITRLLLNMVRHVFVIILQLLNHFGVHLLLEKDIRMNPTYDETAYSLFFEPVSEEDQLYQQMKDVGIRSIERDTLK